MNPVFTPDAKVAKVAETYALDAINLTAKAFQTKLDFSASSIAQVESILANARAQMAAAKPPEEAIWTFAKGFGSYIGEVPRKNHGAEWGSITDGASSYPGLRLKGDALVWPWGRVHQRLVQGDENNVWDYYKVLVSSPPATGH